MKLNLKINGYQNLARLDTSDTQFWFVHGDYLHTDVPLFGLRLGASGIRRA
jgi:hypothetical protein